MIQMNTFATSIAIIAILIGGTLIFSTLSPQEEVLPSSAPVVAPTSTPATSDEPTNPIIETIQEFFTATPIPTVQTPEPTSCEETVVCVDDNGQSYEVCGLLDGSNPCGKSASLPTSTPSSFNTCNFCLVADCRDGYECVCADSKNGSCQPEAVKNCSYDPCPVGSGVDCLAPLVPVSCSDAQCNVGNCAAFND